MTKKNISIKFIGLPMLFILVSQFACSVFEIQKMQTIGEVLEYINPLPTADVVPEFINHPWPELSVDASVFKDAGCSGGWELICSEDSPLSDFGCDRIILPFDAMGGLDPAYPIVKCNFYGSPGYGEYVYYSGGLYGEYTTFVIYKDGEFEMIKSLDEMQKTYAPIDSPTEALSYVLTIEQYSAKNNLEYDSDLRYLVNVVEDTYVEEVDAGYLVHVYYSRMFGCGPHPTTAYDVLITHQGNINVRDFEDVFEDPEYDGLCTD
jgi:hypothetical protein